MFLHLIVLCFLFIDAANIVDIISDTNVIHFEDDSFDSPEAAMINPEAKSFSQPLTFSGHSKSSNRRYGHDYIFDQDSPSVINDVKEEFENHFSIDKSKDISFENPTIAKPIYIENCRLQI